MARFYFDRGLRFRGVSLGSAEAANIFGPGIALLLVAAGLGILWLALSELYEAIRAIVVAVVVPYVFTPEMYPYPHKMTGYFYLCVVGLCGWIYSLLIVGPMSVASAIAADGPTRWPNLDWIFGILVGVVLYGAVFLLFRTAFKKTRHLLGRLFVVTAAPGLFSVFYATIAILLGWLFFSDASFVGVWSGTYACDGLLGENVGAKGPFEMFVVGDAGKSIDPNSYTFDLKRTTSGGGVEKLHGIFTPDRDQPWLLGGDGMNTADDTWRAAFDMKVDIDQMVGAGTIRSHDGALLRTCRLKLKLVSGPDEAMR